MCEDHKISIKKFCLSSHTATCWNLRVERSKHSGAGAFSVSRYDNLVSLIDHEISLSALRNRCSIAGDTLQPQIALQRLLLLKCSLLHYFNSLQLPRMIYEHGKHICRRSKFISNFKKDGCNFFLILFKKKCKNFKKIDKMN